MFTKVIVDNHDDIWDQLTGDVVPPSIEYTNDALPGTSQGVYLSGDVVPPSITFIDDSWTGSSQLSFIPLSNDVKNRLASNAQTATIQVTYHNYPSAAQAAFDYAAKIWSSILVSTVPITIDAYWQSLAPGVLGQAGPNDFFEWSSSQPAGAQSNTWYTVALANQLTGYDLAPTTTDMESTLSSNINWYFGTDGNTPANQYDFVSVALHEILHGLGNIGLANYDTATGQGSWGFGTGYPAIYDRYVENGWGQRILNTSLFPNPSVALGNQLTSNNLFFNGPNAVAGNNGVRPKLYAPSSWRQGSSYAHLDEYTYPRGDPNSLDTPAFGNGESIHDAGSIIRGILNDEGWKLATRRASRDFNSDGQDDILLANPAQGWGAIWTMNGTSVTGGVALPYAYGAVPTGSGDFNSDGEPDILLANPSGGWGAIWTMNGTSVTGGIALPYAYGAVPV
jgi:hypothetical protein